MLLLLPTIPLCLEEDKCSPQPHRVDLELNPSILILGRADLHLGQELIHLPLRRRVSD